MFKIITKILITIFCSHLLIGQKINEKPILKSRSTYLFWSKEKYENRDSSFRITNLQSQSWYDQSGNLLKHINYPTTINDSSITIYEYQYIGDTLIELISLAGGFKLTKNTKLLIKNEYHPIESRRYGWGNIGNYRANKRESVYEYDYDTSGNCIKSILRLEHSDTTFHYIFKYENDSLNKQIICHRIDQINNQNHTTYTDKDWNNGIKKWKTVNENSSYDFIKIHSPLSYFDKFSWFASIAIENNDTIEYSIEYTFNIDSITKSICRLNYQNRYLCKTEFIYVNEKINSEFRYSLINHKWEISESTTFEYDLWGPEKLKTRNVFKDGIISNAYITISENEYYQK
ncbi:MAG: hypothetical protein IPO86_00400 [Saprospiraceae bacterium]|nr:hypothetical protein [Saprospiraceae bacterium]